MNVRLPTVQGGALVEAVGGPFDGEVLYLPSGEEEIRVWHYFDGLRTPCVRCVGDGKSNYLGYYSPGAAIAAMSQTVYWHAAPTPPDHP